MQKIAKITEQQNIAETVAKEREFGQSISEDYFLLCTNMLMTLEAAKGNLTALEYDSAYLDATKRVAKENNISLMKAYNSGLVEQDPLFKSITSKFVRKEALNSLHFRL